MNGADSEPMRQLPTTAARENDCNATQVTSVMCRIWRPSRNSIFCDQSTFVGYQFLTDFDSQNRCLCSMRSHGTFLCAFCLCFHFKVNRNNTSFLQRLRCILWVITLHSTISYYKMRFYTRKTELEASTCQFPRKLRS